MNWISKNLFLDINMIRHSSLVVIGAILGFFLYSFVNFSNGNNSIELILSGIIGVLVSFLIHHLGLFLNNKISWIDYPGSRLLVGIVSEFILSMGSVACLALLYKMLVYASTEINFNALIKIAIIIFSINIIYNVIYYARFSYKYYADGQVQQAKIIRKQTQLQLAALKSQLSPHFLFNSINTLSSLFSKDIIKAEKFIRSLGNSYEYTLERFDKALVTIEEEMNFVEDYINLVKTRFGPYIEINNELPSGLMRSKIPPLTLQMLVENAVKHNLMDEENFIQIEIKYIDGKINVRNNITQAKTTVHSLNIGLKNIASRYELLTDKTIEVSSDKYFTVYLPLVS